MKYFILSAAILLFTLGSFQAISDPTQKTKKKKEIIVSSAIGTVKDHVITSRDVRINYFIEQVLSSKRGSNQIGSLKQKTVKFKKEANNLFLEWIIYLESKLFPSIKASSEEVNRAVNLIKDLGKQSKFWKTLRVEQDELRDLVKRKLLAKKFTYFKFKSSEKVLVSNKGLGKKRDMKADRTQAQQKKKSIFKEWLKVLSNKYRVKKFKSWLDQ